MASSPTVTPSARWTKAPSPSAASSCNDLAYPAASGSAPEADTLYSLLIAAVALVAVLCVYMMQLQSEVHSFAVLRSIGITKGQRLVLMGLESLLLAVPVMLLGVPLGALLTRLALHLLMYAGSTTVQVAVPYEQLWLLLALWLGVIAVSQLVIFLVTVRTPLTGRMQMQENRAPVALALSAVMLCLTPTVSLWSKRALQQSTLLK